MPFGARPLSAVAFLVISCPLDLLPFATISLPCSLCESFHGAEHGAMVLLRPLPRRIFICQFFPPLQCRVPSRNYVLPIWVHVLSANLPAEFCWMRWRISEVIGRSRILGRLRQRARTESRGLRRAPIRQTNGTLDRRRQRMQVSMQRQQRQGCSEPFACNPSLLPY